MASAKKAAKQRQQKAAEQSNQQKKNGNHGQKGKKSKNEQSYFPRKKKDEIVPWGWEQKVKEEKKKAREAREAAEAAKRAEKEAAENGIAPQKQKKQPEENKKFIIPDVGHPVDAKRSEAPSKARVSNIAVAA